MLAPRRLLGKPLWRRRRRRRLATRTSGPGGGARSGHGTRGREALSVATKAAGRSVLANCRPFGPGRVSNGFCECACFGANAAGHRSPGTMCADPSAAGPPPSVLRPLLRGSTSTSAARCRRRPDASDASIFFTCIGPLQKKKEFIITLYGCD